MYRFRRPGPMAILSSALVLVSVLVGVSSPGRDATAAGRCEWNEIGTLTREWSETEGLSAGDCEARASWNWAGWTDGQLVDFWRFTVRERMTVRIEMREHWRLLEPDTYVQPANRLPRVRLTTHRWVFLDEGATIVAVLEPGVYTIAATTVDDGGWPRIVLPGDKCCGDGYDYRLRLTPSSVPPPNPPTPVITPTPRIRPIASVTLQGWNEEPRRWMGVLGDDSDGEVWVGNVRRAADAYEFTLTQPSWVWAHLASRGGVDPYLVLSTTGGRQIETDDNDGTGSDAYIGLELAAGSYRIAVADAGGHRVGAYSLTLSSSWSFVASSVSEHECVARLPYAAYRRPDGNWRSGELSWSDCAVPVNGRTQWADLYPFKLSEPAYVSITMRGRENIDPFVLLRTAGGVPVGANYRRSSGEVQVGAWLAPGHYLIWATKRDRPAGTYWIVVSAN